MNRVRKSLPFTVVIPIPYRRKGGQPLAPEVRRDWEERVVHFLSDCFGGATPMDSQGEYRMADGTVSIEIGQRAVVAACSRSDFRRVKGKIEFFAEEMMRNLDQEAVCVLAFPGGDSFIIL